MKPTPCKELPPSTKSA